MLLEAFPGLAAQFDDEMSEFSPDGFAPEQMWFLTV